MSQLVEHLTILPMPPDFQPGGFSCGQDDVNKYMHTYAVSDQAAGVTRSYLVRDGEEVVAYISVLCDAIHLSQEERPTDHPGAPALKIGLMGVRHDYRGKKYSGRSIGSWLILWAIGLARSMAPMAGLRYVTLDALPDPKLVAWYEKNGFVKTLGEDRKRRIVKKAGSDKYKGKKLEELEMPHVPMRFDIQLVVDAAAVGGGGGASAATAVVEGA